MKDIQKTMGMLLLPKEVNEYFTISCIDIKEDIVNIELEERDEYRGAEAGHEYERNGFYETMNVQDFPLRGKKTMLRIKRRRWLDKTTGRSVGNNYSLVAKGTRHSEEFAAFLKELIGQIPDYGPLA